MRQANWVRAQGPGKVHTATERRDDILPQRLTGAPVPEPQRVHPGVVDVRHDDGDDELGRGDRPVLPALVAPLAVAPATDAVGRHDGAPRPPDGSRVEATVGAGQRHGLDELTFHQSSQR